VVSTSLPRIFDAVEADTVVLLIQSLAADVVFKRATISYQGLSPNRHHATTIRYGTVDSLYGGPGICIFCESGQSSVIDAGADENADRQARAGAGSAKSDDHGGAACEAGDCSGNGNGD
jgi:hypothetical protein